MAINIRSAEGLTPERYDRTYPGTVVKVGDDLKVNVLGNVITARWSDPLVVAEGDSVLVQFIMNKTGLSEAIVRARVGNLARPSRGNITIVPVGSETVTVQATDSRNYLAYFVTSYTPVVGDQVILSWNASIPVIQGKVAMTPAPPPPEPPPPPVPPPPPPPQVGTNVYWASASNTYWPPGGWGSWAGGRGRVYQGNYGSGDVYGAYFYGGGPRQLAGASIDRVRFTLGGRIAAGNYNSPATVHVYLTSNENQPGGNITSIDGPWDVTAWPGQGLTDYDLPVSWGAHFLNGAGLAIFGNPYAGFYGRNEQADSGKLILDWRR